MGLKFDGERRDLFLRQKHKGNLPTRFREVFGNDGPTVLKPILKQQANLGRHFDVGFEGWIRNVLRKCRDIDDPEKRRTYLEVCVERSIRINEIEDWLAMHPDVTEILAPHEMWDVPAHEVDEYWARLSEKQKEADALRGDTDVVRLLISKVGVELAGTLLVKLAALYGRERGRSVIGAACRPQVRNTARYLEAVIERERAG